MNNEFKLIVKTKEYILALEDLLIHVPNKDYYNKQVMRSNLDNILYLIFIINCSKNNDVKIKYKHELIAKLNMLNFYIERYYKLKYISKKEVLKNLYKITEITKMVYGWIKQSE